MAASLLRGLRVDFGLNRSSSNLFSSFLKYHFHRNNLPSVSNSVLSFALPNVLEVRKKLGPFDNKGFSESVRFHLEKLTVLLFTRLHCILSFNIFAVLSVKFYLISIELLFTLRIAIELAF